VGTIASPCINNCTLNEDDICLGCGRLIDEITDWHDANDEQKIFIIDTGKKRLEIIQDN
jgi:predicted Fe-S protein YdhL (DUF1289 family)